MALSPSNPFLVETSSAFWSASNAAVKFPPSANFSASSSKTLIPGSVALSSGGTYRGLEAGSWENADKVRTKKRAQRNEPPQRQALDTLEIHMRSDPEERRFA